MSWAQTLLLAAVIYEANGIRYQSWVCFILFVLALLSSGFHA